MRRLIHVWVMLVALTLVTGDAGAVQPTDAIALLEVDMLADGTGWGIGLAGDSHARVVRTRDGGITWHDVTPDAWRGVEVTDAFMSRETDLDNLPLQYANGVFLDADTAWIALAPEESIWRTTDGGQTWAESTWPRSQWGAGNRTASLLDFVDADHGWRLLSHGSATHSERVSLYRTLDGGVTWDLLIDDETTLASCYKTGMDFGDASSGWITRHCAASPSAFLISLTVDGGESWYYFELPAPTGSEGLFEEQTCGAFWPTLFDWQTGLAVVSCDHGHYLYSTTNGGESWHIRPYPGGQLYALDPSTLFAVRAAGSPPGVEVFRSTDGGQTWTWQGIHPWTGRFSFVDDYEGWVVAQSPNDGVIVMVTNDNGRSWQSVQPQLAE